jgi:hypothetical protein
MCPRLKKYYNDDCAVPYTTHSLCILCSRETYILKFKKTDLICLIGLAYTPKLCVDCIIMNTRWTGYLMLHFKVSIHESERERIGLGDAVGSLIMQGGLQSQPTIVHVYLILNGLVMGLLQIISEWIGWHIYL